MDLSRITKPLAIAFCAISAVNGASPNKGCREFEKVSACGLDNGMHFNVKGDLYNSTWLACDGDKVTKGHSDYVLVEGYNKNQLQVFQYTVSTLSCVLDRGDIAPPTKKWVAYLGQFASNDWECADYLPRKKDRVPEQIVLLASFCRLDRKNTGHKKFVEETFVARYQANPNCDDLGTFSIKEEL